MFKYAVIDMKPASLKFHPRYPIALNKFRWGWQWSDCMETAAGLVFIAVVSPPTFAPFRALYSCTACSCTACVYVVPTLAFN